MKMPHIIVRLWPGKSEQQKASRRQNCQDVMEVLNYGEESVSVALEEIKSQDWKEKIYKLDIQSKWGALYKKPGYEM